MGLTCACAADHHCYPIARAGEYLDRQCLVWSEGRSVDGYLGGTRVENPGVGLRPGGELSEEAFLDHKERPRRVEQFAVVSDRAVRCMDRSALLPVIPDLYDSGAGDCTVHGRLDFDEAGSGREVGGDSLCEFETGERARLLGDPGGEQPVDPRLEAGHSRNRRRSAVLPACVVKDPPLAVIGCVDPRTRGEQRVELGSAPAEPVSTITPCGLERREVVQVALAGAGLQQRLGLGCRALDTPLVHPLRDLLGSPGELAQHPRRDTGDLGRVSVHRSPVNAQAL